MKIYKQEQLDGLADSILNNNTIAMCSVAEYVTPVPEAVDKLQKIIAANEVGGELALAENSDQIDLYYIKSVLVSTGWNKNDDVFDPKELWNARNTPEDKPFNFMHDEKDIIGHITGNSAVDFEGKTIAEDLVDVPTKFEIVTSAVIYTEWQDIEQKQRIHKLVAEIEEGKWFVSMECLFPDFDYALSKDGVTKVIKRSEASAFLTKHLRSYGGDGIYEDYKVGRLLRNLSFSGKGLVSKPANPRSVFVEGNEFFDESKAEIITFSSLKENNMSEINFEKQIDDLRADLAEAKAANEALREKVVAEQRSEFESKIQSLEETIAEQSAKVAELTSANESVSESLKQAEESLASKNEEVVELEKNLAEMKQKEVASQRQAQLEQLGLESEEACATVAEFENLDQETFDKIVAMMEKKAMMHDDKKKKDEEEKEKAMKDKAMKDKAYKNKASEEELAEEIDSAEASEEALEGAEAPVEVAVAEAIAEDSGEVLRSVASEWLGSVLKHNK